MTALLVQPLPFFEKDHRLVCTKYVKFAGFYYTSQVYFTATAVTIRCTAVFVFLTRRF